MKKMGIIAVRGVSVGMFAVPQNRAQLPQLTQVFAGAQTVPRHAWPTLVLGIVIGATFLTAAQPQKAAAESSAPDAQEPTVLDISQFCQEHFSKDDAVNEHFQTLAGRQIIDGVPFEITGRALLFGKKESKWMHQTNYPDLVGIPVQRKFDELHLVHNARWAEAEGQIIAYIRLNYANRKGAILPIAYGRHVRDWSRLASEERETLSDDRSKIIWRGTGLPSFKSTTRVFKSTLDNPNPDLVVSTIDILTTRSLSAYELLAATVARRDPDRTVTPPLASNEPERNYQRVNIVVVDEATGNPIRGAFVDPGLIVDNVVMIGNPFYTTVEGAGVIPYPQGRTTRASASVTKEGYRARSMIWSNDIPQNVTFQLRAAASR